MDAFEHVCQNFRVDCRYIRAHEIRLGYRKRENIRQLCRYSYEIRGKTKDFSEPHLLLAYFRRVPCVSTLARPFSKSVPINLDRMRAADRTFFLRDIGIGLITSSHVLIPALSFSPD